MLSEYVPGQLVRLVRNADYWRVDEAGTTLPYLDGLNYLIVPGTDAQVAQFLAGNLDQLNISGGQFPDFKSRELEFTLTYDNDSATWTDIATIIQNDFAEIGVRANLRGIQSSTLLGTGLSGEYEAILVALGNLPDPELRKPICQPGGSLYYWHRATQPAAQGQPPIFDAMAD